MDLARRIRAVSPSQTIAIGERAKAMKAAGEHVIAFGVGEPDFPTPDHIKKAAIRAIEAGRTGYTASSGIPELRRALCEKFRRDNGLGYRPEEIVVSNGGKHSIFNVCCALIDEGDEVIIPAPYWLTYPEAVKVCGGVPVFLPANAQTGFKITPNLLRSAITERTKLLLFNSPCNPTGAVYSEEETRALAAVCEEAGIYVLSDEIYEKFTYGVKPFSFAASSPWAREHTVTVNGVSKSYAMTGWRIGYLAAPEFIARAIDGFQSHTASNPNTIAQYAALEAIESGKESGMLAVFRERRDALAARISRMEGVKCVLPDGAFYALPDVSAAYGKSCGGRRIDGSVSFAEALLEREKVAVVPGKPFGADGCVRLSLALSMEDLLEGLDRIDAFLHGLK